MSYSFELRKQSEMDVRVENLPLVNEPFSRGKYAGFGYFSPDHVFRSTWHLPKDHPEDRFFMALDNKKVIGVCLLQKSPYDEEKEAWWISFMDIHQDYRRKGIAKSLYQFINEWVDSSMVIYGGMLSADGKSANLHKVRKQHITRCSCYGTSDEYCLAKRNN